MDESMFRSKKAFQAHIRQNRLSGAFEFPDGSTEHYRDGERHREDGPAVLAVDGEKLWYRDGKLHREDGPAVEDADGDLAWYRHGKLHREDGPALEMGNGTRREWFIDGVQVAKA